MSQDVKKALTSVDRSTKSLVNAADVLIKTVTDQTAQVTALTAQQVALATDIEFKQNELENLDQTYSIKIREANADLALRVKENADTVFETLLKERGLVALSPQRVLELEDAVTAAVDSKDEAVRTAVETATASVTHTYEAKLAKQLSDHKVEIAQLNANASSDKKTITLLEGQVADARQDLAEERDVRIKTEEARSRAAAVTVNTTK
jgi:acyl-homoserine lactone acylase PvdQ